MSDISKEDEEWWEEWKVKMEKIRKLEEELNMNPPKDPFYNVPQEFLTKKEAEFLYDMLKQDEDEESEVSAKEYRWVESELKECDKLYKKMFGKEL
tara:strand:+ start:77 stop:364 length:288 start_codon:yes stop_codon:yes gene_type:complete